MDTSGSPVSGDPLKVPKDRLVLSEHEKMPSIHVSDCTAHILEIFPDVEPDHVTTLVADAIQIYGTGTMEWVLHTLLNDPRRPKVPKRGNENFDDDSNGAEEPSPMNCGINYGDHNRPFVGGQNYAELTLVRLVVSPLFDSHAYIMT